MQIEELSTILAAVQEKYGDVEVRLPRGFLHSVHLVWGGGEARVNVGDPVPEHDYRPYVQLHTPSTA